MSESEVVATCIVVGMLLFSWALVYIGRNIGDAMCGRENDLKRSCLIDGYIYSIEEERDGLLVIKTDARFYCDEYSLKTKLLFSCRCSRTSILSPVMPSVRCLISHMPKQSRDLWCRYCDRTFKNELIREICDEYGATYEGQ